MHELVILPIIIPLSAAVLCLLFFKYPRLQSVAAFSGSLLLLGVSWLLVKNVHSSEFLTMQVGSWKAPYGITFVADRLSAAMAGITALIGFAVIIYAMGDINRKLTSKGFYPLLLVMLTGINGAFLTGDIFNLYVWFEVLLIASFVLMSLGGGKAQLKGAIKYVILNLISSFLFLIGIGLLYGETGTLNMADLAAKLTNTPGSVLVNSTAMLFFTAFGIKAAMFPLYFWLPASYHTPPPAISAVFAGLLTKVGVYALIRSFTLFFFYRTWHSPNRSFSSSQDSQCSPGFWERPPSITCAESSPSTSSAKLDT